MKLCCLPSAYEDGINSIEDFINADSGCVRRGIFPYFNDINEIPLITILTFGIDLLDIEYSVPDYEQYERLFGIQKYDVSVCILYAFEPSVIDIQLKRYLNPDFSIESYDFRNYNDNEKAPYLKLLWDEEKEQIIMFAAEFYHTMMSKNDIAEIYETDGLHYAVTRSILYEDGENLNYEDGFDYIVEIHGFEVEYNVYTFVFNDCGNVNIVSKQPYEPALEPEPEPVLEPEPAPEPEPFSGIKSVEEFVKADSGDFTWILPYFNNVNDIPLNILIDFGITRLNLERSNIGIDPIERLFDENIIHTYYQINPFLIDENLKMYFNSDFSIESYDYKSYNVDYPEFSLRRLIWDEENNIIVVLVLNFGSAGYNRNNILDVFEIDDVYYVITESFWYNVYEFPGYEVEFSYVRENIDEYDQRRIWGYRYNIYTFIFNENGNVNLLSKQPYDMEN
jgi:hypothetical protein